MTIPQFTAGQVLTAAELNAMVDAINAGGGKMEVTAFTASGTFTVPAGVTYAVAHILAGGGGAGRGSGGNGGNSSVAFASGTISATGGLLQNAENNMFDQPSSRAGAVNSGQGATYAGVRSAGSNSSYGSVQGGDGALITAGATVTPAASITVTVGAGGTAGTNGAAGGSGYVWIEYVV